jgi:NAD(P)-dependent dehydrogenase (short-subunit alcohol dehydrogenase family)
MKSLIIGASRGLGLGLAQALLDRGWEVTATARHPEQATKIQTLASRYPGKLELLELDVTRMADIDRLGQDCAPKSLQLVVINAGIAGPEDQSVERVNSEELLTLFNTNSLAPIRIATRLLPALAEQGTLAFMSSRLGSIADNSSGDFDLYRASKAALNSLVRSFAATTAAPYGLRIRCLHPGWVRTDMGGPHAPLSVEQSVQGLANVLESKQGSDLQFVDYKGDEIPW